MTIDEQIRKRWKYSPFLWTMSNVVLPKSVPWNFTERAWQLPIFEDQCPRIVSKKSSQVGETTIFICKALWFMDHRAVNVIWTFPRQKDVSEFVQTRFWPILSQSPYLDGSVGRGEKDPQSLHTMRYKNSFIYFQEASVEPRSTSADMLANDEVDRSNPHYLDAFVGRLSDSKFKIHYRFSTPTISNFGIDAIFNNESDARYWMVKCPKCNHYQSLKWDINFMLDAEGLPYYGCEKCRAVLTVEAIISGEYVAMYPNRVVHGYHVTGMMMPISKSPAFMYDRSKTLTKKNFYNLYLGETYETMGMSFDPKTIIDNVFRDDEEPYPHQRDAKGATYMGVDQKGDLHVTIAQLVPGDTRTHPILRLIHAEVIKREIGTDSWRRLSQLMERYNIRFCVHDALPNTHNAQEFREVFRGRVGLKFDGLEKERLFTFDENTGKILLSRTQSFDGFLDDIKSGLWRFWGSRSNMDAVLKEIIAHCGNLKRDEIEHNTRYGGVEIRGVWRKTGPDDYAHSWAYCRLAHEIRPATKMQITLIGGHAKEESDEYMTIYKDSVVWPGRKVPKRVKRNIGLG